MTLKKRLFLGLGLAGLLLSAVAPLQAAGFGIFEHGTKAMGMSSAFTAQADDPSAMFFNAAGIAFQHERDFMLGVTYIFSTEADFQGAAPYPGPNVSEEQEKLSAFPPHFYWVEPINDRMTFGLGINAPFGLSTEWKNEDQFTGRYVSTFASLQAIDVNPTFGWMATDNFSIGVGLIGRFAEVELQNRTFYNIGVNPIPLCQDPSVSHPLCGPEIAASTIKGGYDYGYGFNFGILHKYNNSFSWGLSYRSGISVEFDGDLTMTQIPTGIPPLDGLLGAVLPFGQTLGGKTEIDFPDIASLGFHFMASPELGFEVDINWAGWSSFDTLLIQVDSPTLPDGSPALGDIVRPQNWDDSYNYRLGVHWNSSASAQWRFGYVYDETPQPTAGASPLLPDANRNGFTFGYGHSGSSMTWDLAVMYLPFDTKTVEGESDNYYFGEYNQTAWLVGVSVGF